MCSEMLMLRCFGTKRRFQNFKLSKDLVNVLAYLQYYAMSDVFNDPIYAYQFVPIRFHPTRKYAFNLFLFIFDPRRKIRRFIVVHVREIIMAHLNLVTIF